MRSCLFRGLLAAFLTVFTTVSPAQSDMLGVSRPVKGVAKPSVAPPEAPTLPAAPTHLSGVTIPLNSKLTAGDIISVEIKEDHDPLLITAVTDTGEVELNGLGRVYVSGRTTTEAAALVATHLKQKYYHQATVEIGIKTKASGGVDTRPFRIFVKGKVARPGPQFFTPTTPLKLSEAVTIAGINEWSKAEKVKLTRGGRGAEYDVKAINKGRTDLDVQLKDGDEIYVPPVGIRTGFGD
jgi:protein involved in polysaccharide export with SLBB domain